MKDFILFVILSVIAATGYIGLVIASIYSPWWAIPIICIAYVLVIAWLYKTFLGELDGCRIHKIKFSDDEMDILLVALDKYKDELESKKFIDITEDEINDIETIRYIMKRLNYD